MTSKLQCPDCGFWTEWDKANFESPFTWLMLTDDGKHMHCPKCVRRELRKLAPVMISQKQH